MHPLHICADCGFGTTEPERWENHMIVNHPDTVVDALVTLAFKEAVEIAELNRMWRLTA